MASRRARPLSPAWRDGWWVHARAVHSPNVDARPPGCDIKLVVIHAISLPPGEYGGDGVEALFTNRLDCDAHPYYDRLRGLKVSAHFFVRRDGEVIQFASCESRAWHAGQSVWQGRQACNDFSIGIELEGLEHSPFEPAQYRALVVLLLALKDAYRIADVAGHEHIAPGRKQDPGSAFDWSRLKGLTRWSRRTFALALGDTA